MDAVTGGLLGGSLVAFITGGFNYLNNRKAAPEAASLKIKEMETARETSENAKMLEFWIQQVEKIEEKQIEQIKKIEEKQTFELNGIRQSFENEKQVLMDRHNSDIRQIRQESQAEKTTSDLLISSLNSEIRRIIEQRGEDQVNYHKEISGLKESFDAKLRDVEKEKTMFLTGMLDRFENFCLNIGGKINESVVTSNTS